MSNYVIIMYSYENMKKNPKFQYWITGTKKVIFDHAKAKNLNAPEHEHTKELTRARTILKLEEFNDSIITKLEKFYNGLKIEHFEYTNITEIDSYDNIIFPHFRNNCEI